MQHHEFHNHLTRYVRAVIDETIEAALCERGQAMEALMADATAVSQALDALTQTVSDASQRVSADLDGLRQQVTDLQAQVGANGPDLQPIVDRINQIQTNVQGIDPQAETTPPPPAQ